MFLHQLPDAKQLFEVVAREKNILTSLSKGFGIIDRFSEDVDIQIEPEKRIQLKSGKNHDKPIHIEQRRNFFNALLKNIVVTDLQFFRDHSFDDAEL